MKGAGFVYLFGSGAMLTEMEPLNQHLWRAGYPGVPKAYVRTSSEWFFFYKRFSFSVSTSRTTSPTTVWNGKYTYARGQWRKFALGRLFGSGDWILHISLGAGSSRLEVGIGDHVEDFDSTLTTETGARVLTTSAWDLTPEVLLSRRISRIFFLGVKGGYVYSLAGGVWKSNGITLKGGPHVSLSGPYITLFLGAGILIL